MFTSPEFTGTPIAPTAAVNTNSTQIATTAYVQQELTDFVNDIPSQLRAIEVKKGESPLRERLKDMIRKELMGDNEDETALKDRYMQKLHTFKNMKLNRRSDFEIDQAKKELIDAAKAYGIDLPTK
jgi:hypothetical protein